DGTQQLPTYDPRPTLPTPSDVPSCAATHTPATGAGPTAGVGAGGQTGPGATAGSVKTPSRVIPAPEFPKSSDRELGPKSPLASLVDLLKGLLPLLLVLGLIALVGLTKPWRWFAARKDSGDDE